jgi:hypothetical protein
VKKIAIAMTVTLIALFSTIWTTAIAANFADVPRNNPYFPFIEDLQKHGVAEGVADGLFGPEQPLTRAEFAKLAVNAFLTNDAGGRPASPAVIPDDAVPFTDIQGHWAAPYISAAYRAGIVNGTSETTFAPDQPVKREDAAVMVWRVAQQRGLSSGSAVQYDEWPDVWAMEAVGGVIAHGWYGPDAKQTAGVWTYRPRAAMTRQEAAALTDMAMKELAGGMNTTGASSPLSIKATYIWNVGEIVKNGGDVLRYLQQHGINLVFLQINTDAQESTYSEFIKEAGSLGIVVHAMGGAPDWILPDKQVKLYQLIDYVKTYNEHVTPERRFKGIHLDVEPYLLQAFASDSDTMLGLWKDTISGFVQEMRADVPGLVSGAVIPFWLDKFDVPDGQGGRTTLSDWIIRELDQTTLMAYRDNSTDILSSIENEMNEAQQNGKTIIVAVETNPSNEGPITFYTKGQLLMFQELGKVVNALKNRPPFAGYAIHDYDSWRALKE